MTLSVFFFPWTSKKCPWTFWKKCTWTFWVCPWTFLKNLPVNPKKCPWTWVKCPWTLKVPVNNFLKSAREPQKCPWTITEKSAREHANSCIFGTFEEKVPVNREKCPWTFPNFLPVNHEKCPWKSPKKCPWTHPLAREFSEKVPVNAKLCPWTSSKKWGSRALLMFTGKKKHWCQLYEATGFLISLSNAHASASKENLRT